VGAKLGSEFGVFRLGNAADFHTNHGQYLTPMVADESVWITPAREVE